MAETCRLCGADGKLCKSHAIPKAFFKPILQRNGGSAIVIPGGKTRIHRSTKTGEARLFCEKCEGWLDKNFDRPLIYSLRNLDTQINANGFSARIKAEHDKLAQSVASVFWRAAISDAEMYRDFLISPVDRKILRSIFLGSQSIALVRCSVSIMRLADFRAGRVDAIPQETMADWIFTPNAYVSSNLPSAEAKSILFDMCLQGFLIRMVVPAFGYRQNRKPGFLRKGRDELHAPPIDMLGYKPILAAAVTGYAKDIGSQNAAAD